MNPRSRQTGKESGAVLITTVIILSFLSVLGMGMLALLYSRTVYSEMQVDRLKALYLAEAGISRQIWELRHGADPDGDGVGNIPWTNLGEGRFRTTHDFQASLMTSTGEVNKAFRKIQIKYSAI